MRKVAKVRASDTGTCWLILYETKDAVYVFPCATEFDGSSSSDHWFGCLADAEAACAEEFGVRSSDWLVIPDPVPGCQHDWISPVRARGRVLGGPEGAGLERLVAGDWTPVRAGDPVPGIAAAIQEAVRRAPQP